MKLRDWFVLIGALLVGVMWSEYCYRRGADAGYEQCTFEASVSA